MSLATMKEALDIAVQTNTAVAAFSIDNLEVAQEVAASAEANHRPVIMMIGQYAIKYGKLQELSGIIKDLACRTKVPVVLHLDHGSSYEQAIECIRAGFTSVMFDGSRLPLAENVKITREIVRAANAVGVSVEAELGAIGGVEDGVSGKANLVDVNEVRQFIDQVQVDALAIGIGNAHGIYRSTPNLAFDRLEQVAALGAPPLVLHGGSGIPDDMIRKAIHLGIRKINVATEVRLAFMEGFVEAWGSSHDVYKVLMGGHAAARKIIDQKIRLFNGQS